MSPQPGDGMVTNTNTAMAIMTVTVADVNIFGTITVGDLMNGILGRCTIVVCGLQNTNINNV